MKEPAAQLSHAVVPVCGWNLPLSHLRQLLFVWLPVSGLYLPKVHFSGADSPIDGQTAPTGHSKHPFRHPLAPMF